VTQPSWQERAAPVIAAVLAATAGQDEKIVRKGLRDAYPFGERAYHPYKVWLNEVARQRGVVRMTKLRRDQLARIEAHNTSLFTGPGAGPDAMQKDAMQKDAMQKDAMRKVVCP